MPKKQKDNICSRISCCVLLVVALVLCTLTLLMKHSYVKIISIPFEQSRSYFLQRVCVSDTAGSSILCEAWDELDCHALEKHQVQPYACRLQNMTLGVLVMFSLVAALIIAAVVILALPLVIPNKSEKKSRKLSKVNKYAYHGIVLLSAVLSTVAAVWSGVVFSFKECSLLTESYQALSCSKRPGVGVFVGVGCSVVLLAVCSISLTDPHMRFRSRSKKTSRKLIRLKASKPEMPLSPGLSPVYTDAQTPSTAGPLRSNSARALLAYTFSGRVDETPTSFSPTADASYSNFDDQNPGDVQIVQIRTHKNDQDDKLVVEDVGSP